MKAPASAWLVAHAAATLVALRISESLVRTSFAVGVGLGLAGGLLVITLLASVRYFVTSADTAGWSPSEYLGLIHRLPRQGDFLGTAASCFVWCGVTSAPAFTTFKLFWLVSALFAANALVRRYSYR